MGGGGWGEHISNTRDEKGNIIEFKDIKRITEEYYKHLHANKFNNLSEMNKFLERQRKNNAQSRRNEYQVSPPYIKN